jgi:hypothetical protein
VCSDFEGFHIEALAVNTLTGKIAIRDIDKRYCRGQKPATWVLYSLGKSFKFAECELSASWVQEFAAWPAGCHQQFPVLTVRGGAITITPSGGR